MGSFAVPPAGLGQKPIKTDELDVKLDWVGHWAQISPEKIALKDIATQKDLSYGELHQTAVSLAHYLKHKHSIGHGDRVTVVAKNSWAFVPLFLALQRLGAILVPLNFRLTPRELGHLIEDCEPKLLLFSEEFQPTIEALAAHKMPRLWNFEGTNGLLEVLREPTSTAAQAQDGTEFHAVPFLGGFDDVCMILYTSGTTGVPKGAEITNKVLFWNSINTLLRLQLTAQDSFISFMPFFHTGGWNVLLTPFLHCGAKTLIMEKFDPAQVLDLCQSEGVSLLFAVPTMMDMLAAVPGFDEANFKSLRFAIVGGEPMPIPLIEKWQAKSVAIRQGYGLTEFGPNVFSLNEQDCIRKRGSIGFANLYVQTKVITKSGATAQAGEIGELLLKGPMATRGYWRNPKATQELFKEGWLATGDLVQFDQEGYFYVVGRKKDMFISGGENVYPAEVEALLRTHPDVRDVAVIGVPDPRWNEVGRAFVVLKSGARTTAEDLLGHCQGQLAKFKTPKSFCFLEELPKGDSGKVSKLLLRKQHVRNQHV